MRYANINNSPRLLRTLKVLRKNTELTTLEIIQKARVCAVSAIISELRENGFSISCKRRGNNWFYKLED